MVPHCLFLLLVLAGNVVIPGTGLSRRELCQRLNGTKHYWFDRKTVVNSCAEQVTAAAR